MEDLKSLVYDQSKRGKRVYIFFLIAVTIYFTILNVSVINDNLPLYVHLVIFLGQVSLSIMLLWHMHKLNFIAKKQVEYFEWKKSNREHLEKGYEDAYGNGVVKVVEGVFMKGYYVLPHDFEYSAINQNCRFRTELEALENGFVHISLKRRWKER